MMEHLSSFAVVPQEELVYVKHKAAQPALHFWNMLDDLGCSPMDVDVTDTAQVEKCANASPDDGVLTVVKAKTFTVKATLKKEAVSVGDTRALDVSAILLFDDKESSPVPENSSNEPPITYTSHAVDQRSVILSVKVHVLSSKKENLNFRLAVYGAERTAQGVAPRQRLCTTGPIKVVSKIRKKAYVKTSDSKAKSTVGIKADDDQLTRQLQRLQQAQSRQRELLERLYRSQAAQRRAIKLSASSKSVAKALDKMLDAFAAISPESQAAAVQRSAGRYGLCGHALEGMSDALGAEVDACLSEPDSGSDSPIFDRAPSPEEVMLQEVWGQLNWAS